MNTIIDKKHNYECLFCGKDLTNDLDFGEKVNYPIYYKQIKKNEPLVAFLICIECATNGNFPAREDIEYIWEGWNKGGFLWANYRKMNQEFLLLCLLMDRIKDGSIKIETDQNKIFLSNKWGEKKLMVDINRWNSRKKNEEEN